MCDFGSKCHGRYLLKLRNFALTQSLTCLPGPAFAIFLLLGAEAATSDIWLKLIIGIILKTILMPIFKARSA